MDLFIGKNALHLIWRWRAGKNFPAPPFPPIWIDAAAAAPSFLYFCVCCISFLHLAKITNKGVNVNLCREGRPSIRPVI
jgi:hypothetical protein